MSVAPVRIANAQLGTTASTLYTPVPKARIDAMVLTNTSAAAATATVYLVPSGGTAGPANCILSTRALAANESYIVPGAIGQWLMMGDSVQAMASVASAITMVASGVEYTN